MFKFINNQDRFIEYLNAYKGQYSIRCEHLVIDKTEDNHTKEWVTTGYIYKSYDKVSNKYNYFAKDALGNPIFPDINELHLLKGEFRNKGKKLAEIMKMAQLLKLNQVKTVRQNQQAERKHEIHQLREKGKDKTQQREQQKQEQRIQNIKTERLLDEKQAENSTKDKGGKDNTYEPISKDATSPENESIQDITENRMDELQDLRDQEEDLSQDMEIDM